MRHILFGLAATILATAAPAQTGLIVIEDVPSARVSTSGTDLHSTAGRVRIAGKVHRAAEAICIDNNINPLDVRLQQMACYRTALASGLTQLDGLGG